MKVEHTLYIARHGETQANIEHRFSGKKDTPLTVRGLEQAHQIGAILRRELGVKPALGFVASPLQRARTTMEIVRGELELTPDDFSTDARLQEIDLGEWDQLTDDEARARDPVMFAARGNDKWHVKVPGGENYADVAARAQSWLASLSGDTFAISHGAFIRILRGMVLGLDWKAMSALDEPQGCVYRLSGQAVTRLDP